MREISIEGNIKRLEILGNTVHETVKGKFLEIRNL